jgi:hypothetical protein
MATSHGNSESSRSWMYGRLDEGAGQLDTTALRQSLHTTARGLRRLRSERLEHQCSRQRRTHSRARYFGFAFAIVVPLNTAIVVAELGFGYAANSLALIAAAAHNFTDLISLLLARGGRRGSP